MGSVMSTAIDLALEHMVDPVVLQVKYAFCYSSYIDEMKVAMEDLERKKQLIDEYVADDSYNSKQITDTADHWLKEVEKAQKEVKSLQAYEEGKTKINTCCAQILINPIACNKLGRKAADNVATIKGIVQGAPPREEISSKPKPRGIVKNGLSPEEASQQISFVLSTSWNTAMQEVMTALKDDTINVVGLHGMGGVGKSTMINEVHVQVFKQSMFDLVAKVEVKADVDITRIQEEIASAFGLTLEKNSAAVRAGDLRKRLLQKMKGNQKKMTVLIILDDLVEKLDLQVVGIPSSNDDVQIKLLLTSRDEYLLSDKMRAQPIHLDALSNLDALTMFKIVARLEKLGEDAKKLEKAELIAPKCGGLPVVILAIANALKNKALKEWEDILQRLDVTDALSNLEVSYEHLPSQESKHLFLLCGIIRGQRILVRDLLKYTFGLGLYERKDIHTLEAAANELTKLLSGLQAASMLLKSEDVRYVNIHDRMRDLAARIVDRDHRELAHFTLRDYRCKLPRRFDATKLELVFSYCEDDSLEVQDSFFKDMKKLYVLQFTNLRGFFSLPSPTHHDLGNLETLCLHECRLSDISMIGELKGLQILSFRGSYICKLPIELGGLTALKMLDLSDCVELTQIEPSVLGSFTKLEELNMENSFKNWEIDQGGDAPSSNARLIELRNMSRLNNLRIHIPKIPMLPKDGKLFSSKLSMYQIMLGTVAPKKYWQVRDRYQELSDEYNMFSRVLMVTCNYSPDILWQDWAQTALETAEVLYLSGRLDEKCESISDICIKGFECLKHLRMNYCPSFRFLISPNDRVSSRSLESLYIEKMESLETLCGGHPVNEEAFNILRTIHVDDCKKLTHLFDFSLLKGRLSSQIEEITVKGCTGMQYIVVSECDNNYDDVITLSKLKKLEINDLRNFSSFCAGDPTSNVVFMGGKVAFPCLESLKIEKVEKLEDIWHPMNPPAELGNIRSLRVEGCNKLVRVINSNVLMRLQQHLEYLSIQRCGLMKQVFDVDDGIITSCRDQHLVLFSRLKEFYLESVNKLESIHNNKNLMMMMTIFPNIETLYFSVCPHLRYVLCCSLPTTTGVGGYANLKEITIWDCEEMETVVVVVTQPSDTATATEDIDAVSYSYSSLKLMRIRSCPNLKTFSSQENSVADDNLSFFSQKEIFPCLESLFLSYLSKLGEIWAHEVPSDQTSFNMLKDVTITDCPELSVVFPSTLIPHLDNLREFVVRNCEKMIQIIIVVDEKKSKHHDTAHGVGGGSNSRVEEEATIVSLEEAGMATTMEMMMFTFPCLRKLLFDQLPKLDRFYSSSSTCSFQFHSLETVEIGGCRGVKTLFSQRRPTTDSDSDMVGALFGSFDILAIPNLKSFTLSGLTKFWNGEKPPGLILKMESLTLWSCYSSGRNLQSLLPVGVATYLTELIVLHCHELEYLLTPIEATNLVHLTCLVIRKCDNLKQVVAVEEEEAGNENEAAGIIIGGGDDHIPDIIKFTHLKVLRLESLPKLEKFSSVNNIVLIFPFLDNLDIKDCFNMTSFSNGNATTMSTHKFGDVNSFVQNIYTENTNNPDDSA